MRSLPLYFILANLLVLGLFAQEEHTFDLSEIDQALEAIKSSDRVKVLLKP